MKKFLTLTVALLTLVPAIAQNVPPPVINVSGSAEVKVAPDEIYLRVGVETRDENLDIAKKQNDERIAKTLAFLKTTDVKSKDIQTDYLSIEPNYENGSSWTAGGRTKPVHYTVRKSIEIKLTKVETFEPLLTGLLTNGVNTVHGIDFRTTQLRKHRDNARAMAIRAAKEKADAMAATLDVKCGKVYNINANDSGGWWSSGSYWGGRYNAMNQNSFQNIATSAGESSDDATLSLGQISVSASVNVSFLIE
jgi:uncharacterized protein YggE